jgi:hypothetical protein
MLAELGSVFASVCGFLYIEYKTFAIDIPGSLIITVLTLAAIILLNYRYCILEVTSYIAGTVLNNNQPYHDSSIRFATIRTFLRQIENFFGPPSNKTIDDFSKLSSLHMVETFQAIKLCSKVRKNKELMKELFARYIFGKLSSDQ